MEPWPVLCPEGSKSKEIAKERVDRNQHRLERTRERRIRSGVLAASGIVAERPI
jgi:hypothetical protein